MRIPEPGPFFAGDAGRLRGLATVLTALDSRYMPKLDPEWISVSQPEVDSWLAYRAAFKPMAVLDALGCSPEYVKSEAEWLLQRARRIDPMGPWSALVARGPSRKWDDLSGAARAAVDHRVAAELLLLFYEELARAGVCAPIDPPNSGWWEPLQERLSRRDSSLDELLAPLGLSPHPGVVIVVEGESEGYLVPRVFDLLELRRDPDLVRIVVARGNKADLAKFGAFVAAPLVGERKPYGWDVIRPPSRLLVLFDPENEYATADSRARRRRLIVDEIQTVVRAQGAELSDSDAEEFVHIHTWSESCFEFEHFTDDEPADALLRVQPTLHDGDRARVARGLAAARASHQDVKVLWQRSGSTVSKTRLAEMLWPVLEAKITAALADEAVALPAVAEQVYRAYRMAKLKRPGNWAIPSPAPPVVEALHGGESV